MHRALVIVFAGSLTVLAACSSETSGTPSPASTPAPSTSVNTSQQVPGPGVPKVDVPIDIERFRSAPCLALTDSQATEIFGRSVPPRPDVNAPAGPSCGWDPADGSGASVNVIFSKVREELGLTGVYAAKGTSYKFFEPVAPIEGYPAVLYGSTDSRSEGICSMAIGTSDRSTVDLGVTQNYQKNGTQDPCLAAQTVASKIVTSLKAGR